MPFPKSNNPNYAIHGRNARNVAPQVQRPSGAQRSQVRLPEQLAADAAVALAAVAEHKVEGVVRPAAAAEVLRRRLAYVIAAARMSPQAVHVVKPPMSRCAM